MKSTLFVTVKSKWRILIMSTLILAGLILFSLIKFNRPYHLFIDISFYVMLVISIFWMIVLYSFYKTRIEISQKDIYAPFYIWYPTFSFDEDEVPIFKTVLFKDVDAYEIDQTTQYTEVKEIPFIKLSIKDKYALCIRLDAYNDEEINRIKKIIEKNMQESV